MLLEITSQLLEYYDKTLLFGLILFTEEHPHVIKMLRDTDYYDALDKITGDQIAVFTTMLFRGEYTYPSPPPGTFAMMRPIWKEPQENKKILSWFDIEDTRALPLFVLFGMEGNALYYQKYPIQSKSVEDMFNSLQQMLSVVSDVAKKDTGSDRKAVFGQAQWEMKQLQYRLKAEETRQYHIEHARFLGPIHQVHTKTVNLANIEMLLGEITIGDTFNLSGDFRGAILNIKSKLENVSQNVNQIPHGDPLIRNKLKQLIEQLNGVLQEAPLEKAEEVRAVAASTEQLVDSATEEKPDRATVQITAEGLKTAAEKIGSVLPAVLTIATKIVAIVIKLID